MRKLRAVVAATIKDKQNDYLLFGGSFRRRDYLHAFLKEQRGDFDSKVLMIPPFLADVLWNRIHAPRIESLVGAIDLLHTSDWTEPPSKAFKVTTVHDLSVLHFPELANLKIKAVHERKLKWVEKETDIVIVPSVATKDDLVDIGFSRSKIVVIPEASVFKKVNILKIQKVKRKHNISGKYLLSVGINPRKNTARIISSYKNFSLKKKMDLVLVGKPFQVDIESDRSVKVLGYVPDEDLAALYSGAEMLVFPSLYEGFGLPILDAFSCEVPVVTSNISSMPEVAGGAAILVDPFDEDSIVAGMEMVLKRRRVCVQKGLQRLKKYSWEKTAKETLRIYNSFS